MDSLWLGLGIGVGIGFPLGMAFEDAWCMLKEGWSEIKGRKRGS